MCSGKKSSRTILLILLSIISMLLIACGGSNKLVVGKAPADQQILVLPISGYSDISTFDPALSTDFSATTVINMIFTGLVSVDDHLRIHNELAASYFLADDGVTWTFPLKSNLRFSDGTPLTSADIAYSIDRALSPELKSPSSLSYLGLIKDSDKRYTGQIKTLIGDSLLTPDPNTIKIVTNERAPYFLQTLAYQTSYVVEKRMIDRYGNNFADHLSEGIGGNGPFKVERYIHSTEVDFVPNPYFFGPRPQVKKVVMPIFRVNNTTYEAYLAKQVDQAPVSSQQAAQAKALPDGQFHQYPILEVDFITMNYLVKPLNNIKIRQAFALAVNKEVIAHNIYKDTVIATNHIIPAGMSGYNPALTGPLGAKGTSSNPALAKQLFQEGLKEEGLTLATLPPITFSVSSLGSQDALNEYAAEQQMWKDTLGVTVQIDDMDRTTLLGKRDTSANNPNGLQMWALRWIADYPDPQDWLMRIFGKGSSYNGLNYGQNHSSDAAEQQANQRLMEQADVNSNPITRIQQYNQAEQQLINDVAWIPRFQAAAAIVRTPCVVGRVDNAQSLIPPDDWGSIYISTATPCANISQYK